jgi:tRNA dimethylallyltransferase
MMALNNCDALYLASPVEWLNARLALRFDMMINAGALDEAQANLEYWNPDLQSSQAIGAPEMIAYLHGQYSLEQAKAFAVTASRQYAKRQRTWFRKRMGDWRSIAADQL